MAWQTPTLNWNAQNYFNYSDFNRAENNTVYVSALLNAQGYINALNTTITNRTNVNLDFYDSLNRIEANILSLQQSLGYVPTGWITPVTAWTYDLPFDYNTANRWEQDVNLIYTTINNIVTEYIYCGAVNAICGEDQTYL